MCKHQIAGDKMPAWGLGSADPVAFTQVVLCNLDCKRDKDDYILPVMGTGCDFRANPEACPRYEDGPPMRLADSNV